MGRNSTFELFLYSFIIILPIYLKIVAYYAQMYIQRIETVSESAERYQVHQILLHH